MILREAREARKLSMKDVGRETNITPRYVDALENEDYSVFPGETYALGFLRSYAEYLNLDVDHLLNLYRGHQIDLSEAPLKELTRPTGGVGFRLPSISMPSLSLPGVNFNPRLLIVALVFAGIAGIIALFVTGTLSLPKLGGPGGSSGEAAYCDDPNREIIATTLPQQDTQPRLEDVSTSNTLRFAADSLSLKFCLQKIEQNPGQPARGEFRIRINDDLNYGFTALQGETVTLSPDIGAFEGLNREIKITPQILADFSSRVEFRVEASATAVALNTPEPGGETPARESACEIQVTLQFISDSYFQWSGDGTSHQGRTIAAGERRPLEAESRLQIRVGNGGGVRIFRDGSPPRVAGPPGKIVELEYRRVPDPLDPGRCKVEEIVRVAR
ncbi:MAG: DUF4115 domain-containing protein [bacterium]|nr:DUF4115 domain-containing protein [bacterium]